MFLIWIDPPYGNQRTVLCENFVDYSIMEIGVLQISNLVQINERLKTLSRGSSNLDRSTLNKSLRQSSRKATFILYGMLLAVGILFVIDTSIVYPAVKMDPVAD
jgi:Ni/Fe-hydrogenase subunit HybB-like protein